MADGPIKFNKSIDDNLNIENVSRFGRNFSILRVPYALKIINSRITSYEYSIKNNYRSQMLIN